MRRTRRWLLKSLAAAVSCAAAPAIAQHIPGTAARVNGVAISNLRLERHFEEYLKEQRRNISSMINPRVYKKIKREALDQLIEREVLWQAARGEGKVATDDEVATALQAMQAQLSSREAYLRKLEQAGFDEKSYGEYLRQDLSGVTYLRSKSSASPTVSDEEVAAFYAANTQRFHRPEAVHAQHILVRAVPNAPPETHEAARTKIASVRTQLLAGRDFADLARRFSEDASASQGGDLGSVARGRMVKPFEDALFALAPGQVSDVVQTGAGYHLIKAGERVAAVTQPLDEVRDAIRTRLLAEKRTALAREIVARLKAAATIDILVHLD